MEIEEIQELSELEITKIIARDIIGTEYLEIEGEIFLVDDDNEELFAPLHIEEHTFMVQRCMLVYGYKIQIGSTYATDTNGEEFICFRMSITLEDGEEIEFTSPNLNRLFCICSIWAQQQVE